MVKDLISVVIRFHDETRVRQLDEALFSLSTQSYKKLQVILMVQNGSPALVTELKTLITKQPFSDLQPTAHQVIPVTIPPGIDGRSYLLNSGIQASEGQYLAFLDYDDVVYPQSYEILIQRILASNCPIAVGGCRLAIQKGTQSSSSHLFTESKRPYLLEKRTKLDLFVNNFIPIHTFVIDRSRVDNLLLQFNTHLKYYEDYEVLLKLASRYEFDFAAMAIPVAEYRIRNDGSNSIPTSENDTVRKKEWEEAKLVIQDLKNKLQVSVNATDIQKLVEERDRLLLERKAIFFQIAAFLVSFSNHFPRLKAFTFKLIRWVGRNLLKTRKFIVRSIRYND